eukprot:1157663-Pelagomonas_calceolata.AAC.1
MDNILVTVRRHEASWIAKLVNYKALGRLLGYLFSRAARGTAWQGCRWPLDLRQRICMSKSQGWTGGRPVSLDLPVGINAKRLLTPASNPLHW